MPEYK